MRRPTTLTGLVVHLARLHARRHPQRWALALAALTIGPAAVMVRVANHHPAHTVHARLLAPGRCAVGGMVCVTDATCAVRSSGDRCVDVAGLDARLAHAARADEPMLPISPSLAWNGDGYGMAWVNLREEEFQLWFQRLDAEGKRLGRPLRIGRDGAVTINPQVVWSGAGYAVAWTEVRDDAVQAMLQRLDAQGAAAGAPVKLGAGDDIQLLPRLAWNGREYAATWLRFEVVTQMSAHFARIAPDGRRVGGESTLGQRFFAFGAPDLAFNGDGYGVAWNSFSPRDERSETMYAPVNVGGVGARPVKLAQSEGTNGAVALAWNGATTGAVWEDNIADDATPSSALVFAAVNPNGSVSGARRPITDRKALALQPALAWSGSQYALAWSRIDGDGASVRFLRLGRDGASIGAETGLTSGSTMGLFPAIQWNGTHYAAAWTQVGSNGVQIVFTRLNADGRRVGGDVPVAP